MLSQPAEVLQRIATAMAATLHSAASDARIPRRLLALMEEAWQSGIAHAGPVAS